jgi:hypothetical protein
MGQFDTAEEVEVHMPFAIQRLHGTQPLRTHDATGTGPRNDWREDEPPQQEHRRSCMVRLDDIEAIVVRHMPFDKFRQKLVKHFDILFRENKLQWPSRCGRITLAR